MKSSAKSSLPTAAILLGVASLVVLIFHERLKNDLLTRVYQEHPYIGETAFVSDGSLVHVVGMPNPLQRDALHWQIRGEDLSPKTS